MGSHLAAAVRLAAAVMLAAVLMLAGPAARAHAEFTGLVRLSPFTVTDSNAKGLTATCPAGTRVISAGGDTTPGSGRVILDMIRPDPTLTKVTLHAREDETGTSATWFLQAFVICAAAPPGLQLVTATSPVDSNAKSAVATCPSGTRLLGGGAETTGASGQVLLTGIRPTALTTVTAGAREDPTGTSANWSVTAYAICSTAAGVRTISAASSSDSGANKVATATCPPGMSVVGTFGAINSSAGHVVLDAIFPDAGLTSANISAFEDATGTTASWSLTAYAICAASARLTTFTPSRGAVRFDSVGAGCPAGTSTVGVGADLVGALGRAALLGMGMGLSSFSAVGVTHPYVVADSWTVALEGICSTPFTSTTLFSSSSVSDSEQQKSVSVTCDSGRRLLGVSGVVSGNNGENVLLEAARPDSTLTTATAIGIEDEDGTDTNWSVTVYAICAPPPPGLQLVTADTPLGNGDFAQATASCPATKHVVGTGHSTFFASAELMLDEVGLEPTLSRVTMTVFEDHDGANVPWQARVYAICINR
jgi:hypothetical protein